MYKRANPEQMCIDAFFLPFGGKLDKNNRWVKLARMMPWRHIEEIYVESLDENTGRPSLPARIAFGAIFIKEAEDLTDAGTVRAVHENPYMQYFLGLHEFEMKPLFDASMMVHFRKRFPVEEVEKINEFICTGKWPENLRNVDRNDEGNAKSDESPEQEEKQEGNPEEKQKEPKNEGTLILDATVADAVDLRVKLSNLCALPLAGFSRLGRLLLRLPTGIYAVSMSVNRQHLDARIPFQFSKSYRTAFSPMAWAIWLA